MSKERWTPRQKEAIAARGGNLLVAAAAGAGKTSVLVERIISYLKDRENPIDVDRLLVVTFTNAAAAQMREKIGRELTRGLGAGSDPDVGRQAGHDPVARVVELECGHDRRPRLAVWRRQFGVARHRWRNRFLAVKPVEKLVELLAALSAVEVQFPRKRRPAADHFIQDDAK